MRAALTATDSSFEIATLPDPVPGPGELVVRVAGCGICGSDLKARPMMPAGTVMGHELGGEVVAVGAGAHGWKEGMRAAVLPVHACGECDRCRAGNVAHCEHAQLVGLGGAPGGFAELTRVSASHAFPLPDALPASAAPLVEPFAVGLHTARLAAIEPGDDVLVIGAGPVGLTTARWARELGAGSVTVSDPVARRRVAAPRFGATGVVDPAAGLHGRIVIAGVCAEPDPYFPIVPLMKELSIRFSVYYLPDEFRAVVTAFADGVIDPAPLVTRTVALGDLDAAFAALTTAPDDLKILVDPTA